MSSVVSVGEEKITAWIRAARRIDDLKKDLSRAQCDCSNAESALGKWLAPETAERGESFCVWYGDSLIRVRVGQGGLSNGDLTVDVRQRGKSLDKL